MGAVLGRNKKILAAKEDTLDFALAPHVLGWETEEKIRQDGLKKTEFEFGQIIGVSMFGMVKLCRHKQSGNFVAIKCVWKKEVARLKQVKSITIEKEVMQQLNHPFIARCGGVFQDVHSLYTVVELAPGGDVFTLLKRQPNKRLEDPQAKFYAAGVAVALQYLHNRDLIFRALNTENVVIDANGYIKLIDFQQVAGVVDRPNHGRSEHTGRRLTAKDAWTTSEHPGPELVFKLMKTELNSEVYQHDRRRFTPHFFSPEVVRLNRHGKESDWWSFGIFVHELICGYPPYFDSEPPGLYQKICNDPIEYPTYVQPIVRDLMAKTLEKDRFKRLGYLGAEEIMKHHWFNNFPWQRLCYHKIKAPFIPNLSGPNDPQYFLEYPAEVGREERFGEDIVSVGAVFQAFDEIGGPSLTLLPPRHCMYGLDPSSKPTVDQMQAWEEEDKMFGDPKGGGGGGGDDDEDEEGGEKGDAGDSGVIQEMQTDKQEVVDKLVEAFGISPSEAIKTLKKYKWDEEKASDVLEKQAEKKEKQIDDNELI